MLVLLPAYNGGLYKTTDGGLNWGKLTVPVYADDKQITSIEIVDENVCMFPATEALQLLKAHW